MRPKSRFLGSTAPPRIEPATPDGALVVQVQTVAAMLDCSTSTVRRIEREVEDFPRSFRLRPQGDRQWIKHEIVEWLERRTGRPVLPPREPLNAGAPA